MSDKPSQMLLSSGLGEGRSSRCRRRSTSLELTLEGEHQATEPEQTHGHEDVQDRLPVRLHEVREAHIARDQERLSRDPIS